MSKKKSANALTAAVIIAVAGWVLFLQKYMKEGSDSDNPANDLAAPSVIQEEDGNGQISAEELARLEREKEEALRMAKLQMEQAKADQERKIAEVQARLAKEEAARAAAEEKALQTRARLDDLSEMLEAAKASFEKLSSESAENSQIQKAEMAAAIEAAQKEKDELKRQQEELERKRLMALAEQERIEAELRAELEKYRRIENWDYSYPVLPEHFKRAAHISVQAKMKANPNQ